MTPGTRGHGPAPDRTNGPGPADGFRLRPFRPAWWAPGPHAQTLAGKLLRPDPRIHLERERWATPDGDFLDVDFAPDPVPGAPIVVVLHGLEGSSRRGYALVAYRELAARGIRAVGVNFRSCSGQPNRLPRSYHSGDTGDVDFVLETLARRFPGRPFGAMGFSLGGNVLLKFMGEQEERGPSRLRASVAVSVPYDLAAGTGRLESSFTGRLYARWFIRSLRGKLRAKRELLEGRVPLPEALSVTTLRAFDDLVTAPLHGFRDAAHYYDLSSSARFLDRIRVPCLLLHALDDPFLPPEAIPVRAMAANPHLQIGIVEGGGHVGFLEGSLLSPRFWAEEEAARFLAACLGAGSGPDDGGLDRHRRATRER